MTRLAALPLIAVLLTGCAAEQALVDRVGECEPGLESASGVITAVPICN
ncbi:hypothetical protein [Pontivivens ytuae]|uniref:Lipoprotein n=1 Tax=Pontivivens ytuae TaxID=2789856 RepID=A0A7S9LUW4_9RHOB|nr:hypothetical protein [Pontivivens ytuae]QPH55707.1 hypothetical protein I0K15_08270 [Pontivivens ytuae]